MKKTLLYTLFFTGLITHAQSVRKYSNEFMNIGVDAAALGMSNSVVATTGDVNSGYWNPAGLVKMNSNQVSLMHASYFESIANYDYAAYGQKIDDMSSWGMSLIRFGVDDIMNTSQLIDGDGSINYDRISLFSTADYGLTFSYARKMKTADLQYGVNAKVIRRVIGNFANSWGFGFDVGLQYSHSNWRYGLMLRDITTTMNVWSVNEKEYKQIQDAVSGENQALPENAEITLPKAQLGIARKFIFNNDCSLLTAVNLNTQFARTHDIISSEAMSIDPALGLEFSYTEIVFLRAGVGNFQDVTQIDGSQNVNFQPNIGLGFKYKGIQVDYALTDLGDQSTSLYSNIFSLKVDLNIFK